MFGNFRLGNESVGSGNADDSEQFPSHFNANRRTSVSAECVAPPGLDDEPPEASSRLSSNSPSPAVQAGANEVKLRESLRQIFLFAGLSDDALSQVLHALVARQHPAGSIVIQQGDEGDYFYIVESGSVEYIKDGERVAESGPGSSFGELALLYNSPRAATVRSVTAVKLWALDRITFKNIMVRKLASKRAHSRLVLSQVDILKHLEPGAQLKLADALQPVTYKQDELVLAEGEPGDKFYLIDEGEAEVSVKGSVLARLGRGNYFGELALLYNTPRNATVTARTPLKLESLDKLGFERLLGQDVVNELRKRDPRNA